MACPGGCIGGAGQPLGAIKDMKEVRENRIQSLYKKDNAEKLKKHIEILRFRMLTYLI